MFVLIPQHQISFKHRILTTSSTYSAAQRLHKPLVVAVVAAVPRYQKQVKDPLMRLDLNARVAQAHQLPMIPYQ